MGIVKPPWTSQAFFDSVPFNFCDHFGNKEKLALLCKICRDEIIEERHIYEGKDLDDPVNFFIMLRTSEDTNLETRGRIYLFHKSDEFGEYLIYEKAVNYGDAVGFLIQKLIKLPKKNLSYTVALTVSSLSHSECYIISKIRRALSDLKQGALVFDEDAKTSALLTYLAVTRNSRMCSKLSKEISKGGLRKELEIFSELSLVFSQEIRATFFPEYKGEFDEIGAAEYY